MESSCYRNLDKLSEITVWLKAVFKDDLMPKYGVTDSFVNDLHIIMQTVGAFEASKKAQNHFIEQSFYEHDMDCDRMLHQLASVGFTLEASTGSVCQEAKALAALADLLSLGDTEETSYMLALTDIKMEKEMTTSQLISLEKSIESLQKNLTQSLLHTETLERLVHKQEKEAVVNLKVTSSHNEEAEFLAQKVVKYKADQKKLENNLARCGLTRGLLHPDIVSDHAKLNKVEGRLASIEQELEMFSNLPPDKEVAKVKLAVTKAELEDLENELAKQIDMYHI